MPTQKHTHILRSSTYTNASCAPCHILPLTHLCSHVDICMIFYTHPQIHTTIPPCTPKLTVTFTPVHMYMEAHTLTFTLVHRCSHTSTHMLICIRASCPLHVQIIFTNTFRNRCTLAHAHEHPSMLLCTLMHARGHLYHGAVQMHFL